MNILYNVIPIFSRLMRFRERIGLKILCKKRSMRERLIYRWDSTWREGMKDRVTLVYVW
jgi:hypothetical protein